ncbi:hypothetical protein L3Q82_000708 [Scortum barcoo]|uniref:Uncharacterized protein n=1 Tax=Scortum barcoo TaxID=214431 RepID=A0ACB8WD88_9TELE|nr:hypothetical protein L3Q82_000708 [Scortum barcoo]
MIVDFRRGRHLPSPLYIGGTAVEVVSSFRYLGVHISDDLTWSKNTSCLIRKAHQRLYFLRRLRRAGMGSSVLTSFYRCVVESVLSSCIIVWHGSCSAAEKKALQRVVKAAQRTVGCSLPTTTDIYTSRCRKRASCIMKDPTHTAHALFVPLPSGRRLRSIKSRTTRLRNSFFPEALDFNFKEKYMQKGVSATVVNGMDVHMLLNNRNIVTDPGQPMTVELFESGGYEYGEEVIMHMSSNKCVEYISFLTTVYHVIHVHTNARDKQNWDT